MNLSPSTLAAVRARRAALTAPGDEPRALFHHALERAWVERDRRDYAEARALMAHAAGLVRGLPPLP